MKSNKNKGRAQSTAQAHNVGKEECYCENDCTPGDEDKRGKQQNSVSLNANRLLRRGEYRPAHSNESNYMTNYILVIIIRACLKVQGHSQ